MAEEKKQQKTSDRLRETVSSFMSDKKRLQAVGLAGGLLVLSLLAFFLLVLPWQDAGSAAYRGGSPATRLSTTGAADLQEQSGDLLPQAHRTEETDPEDIKKPDYFSGPAKLVGLLTGGKRGDLAIIETPFATYLATKGELIDDYWTLAEIAEDYVLLRAEGKSHRLEMKAEASPVLPDEPEGEGEEEQ